MTSCPTASKVGVLRCPPLPAESSSGSPGPSPTLGGGDLHLAAQAEGVGRPLQCRPLTAPAFGAVRRGRLSLRTLPCPWGSDTRLGWRDMRLPSAGQPWKRTAQSWMLTMETERRLVPLAGHTRTTQPGNHTRGRSAGPHAREGTGGLGRGGPTSSKRAGRLTKAEPPRPPPPRRLSQVAGSAALTHAWFPACPAARGPRASSVPAAA